MSPAHNEQNPETAKTVEGAGGVVLDRQGRVLLIRHRNGNWLFPKGHVDPGESELEAALREVAEEAGVRCSCPDPANRFTTEYVNARGERRRITWFVLRTDAAEPTMHEPQFPEGAFVPAHEALRRLTYGEDRELLRQVLEVSE